MRVVLALDKFKGTFSARQVSEIIAEGIRDRSPKVEIVMRFMADGGDGSAEILTSTLGLEVLRVDSWDFLGKPTDGKIYWQNSRRLAVLESAEILGVKQNIAREEFLLKGSSWGFGKLIQKSFLLRPQEIWLCIGGTLTADLGWGIASIFGLVATDADGNRLKPSNENLGKVRKLSLGDLPDYIKKCRVNLLCDVRAPILDSKGGISLFSFLQQKGLQEKNISEQQKNILSFCEIVSGSFPSVPKIGAPFTGCGGGLLLGLSMIFPEIKVEMGAKTIAKAIALQSSFSNADFVVCGEGCLDELTLSGKSVFIVAEEARRNNCDLLGVFGKINGSRADFKSKLGLKHAFSIVEDHSAMTSGELIRFSKTKLFEIGQKIGDLLMEQGK